MIVVVIVFVVVVVVAVIAVVVAVVVVVVAMVVVRHGLDDNFVLISIGGERERGRGANTGTENA